MRRLRRFIYLILRLRRVSPLEHELRRQIRRLEVQNAALLDKALMKHGQSPIQADGGPAILPTRVPQSEDWKVKSIKQELKVWVGRIEELTRLAKADPDFEPILAKEVAEFNAAVQSYS